jgi:squalene cyclase
MSSWANGDATAAGQWLQTLPAGATREAAVRSYVDCIASSSPELAARLAETLTDSNQRNSQIENVARQWLESDRPAAEAWLAKVNLPEDQKKELLKRP